MSELPATRGFGKKPLDRIRRPGGLQLAMHSFGNENSIEQLGQQVLELDAASGGKVGGNWRRADVGDLSADGLSYVAADGRVYFADVIARAKDRVDSPWTPEIAFQSDTNSL